MAQFSQRLQNLAGLGSYPVLDATGLEGGWDFTLTYGGSAGAGGSKGGPAPAAAPNGMASDPAGGVSILDAVEKQLGLKLETSKRPVLVLVIDHMEEKPTEN
jgi:uncharacterized protein (TIGR03435 family)